MLAFITVMFVVTASVAGGIEYTLWSQGRLVADAERRDGDGDIGRRLSLVTESLAAVGAILVLAGTGVAISQSWLRISNWGQVDILVAAAICFLIAGFVVRWLTESVTYRLTELMWFSSVICGTGAVASAAAGIYRQTAAATVVMCGLVLAIYAAALWLLCRREALLAAAFAGLTAILCAMPAAIAAHGAPWLAVGFGLWLLGAAWIVLGSLYAEPLGTSIPAGAAIALVGPAIAVHEVGWVYVIGIGTAAAVMAASIPLRNVVLVGFGSAGLFGYVTAVVLRYANRSIGVPGSLVVIGLVLIGLAIVTTRLALAGREPPDDGARADPPVTEPRPTELAGIAPGNQS